MWPFHGVTVIDRLVNQQNVWIILSEPTELTNMLLCDGTYVHVVVILYNKRVATVIHCTCLCSHYHFQFTYIVSIAQLMILPESGTK